MSALVSLSGGMDSVTLLAYAIKQWGSQGVQAVGFTYGSKHNPYENEAARQVALHYGVPFSIIDITGVMVGFKSNLLSGQGEIPEGHYEEASMSKTVVPCRNLIFASILAGLADSREIQNLYLGIHAGDHAIYPDCRPEFFYFLEATVRHATERRVTVRAPFLHMNKTSILQWGVPEGVPYDLTRTCYKDQKKACGKCGSCQERLEAFLNIGMKDPIEYEQA